MYVLLRVGCLECAIPTDVLLVTEDHDKAMIAFATEAGEKGELPGAPYGEKSETAILIGKGRQIQYQLHRIA